MRWSSTSIGTSTRNSTLRRSPTSQVSRPSTSTVCFARSSGEALGDYVRRRRLEIAGVRLLSQEGVSVLNIALGVGFGSAEAFTRAFRARFDCSPTEWRKSKRGQTASKRGQAEVTTVSTGRMAPSHPGRPP